MSRRWIAWLLTAGLLLGVLSGCGGNGEAAVGNGAGYGNGDENAENDGNVQDAEWAEGTPMGRYVEKPVEFASGYELYGSGGSFYQLDDGRLILMDNGGSMKVTRNSARSWGEEKRSWYLRMQEQQDYIMSMAIGADDTVAVIWHEPLQSDAPEQESEAGAVEADSDQKEEANALDADTAGQEADKTDGDAEESGDEQEEENVSAQSSPMIELNPHLLIIKPDGTETPIDVEIEEDDSWITSVYISDTGKIIVGTLGTNLYEIQEDGSFEKFLAVEDGRPELIQFHDNLMFMDGWGYESILIYDMDAKEYIEDEVLEDFVKENYSGRQSYTGEFYDMYFMPDQDGTIYIAGAKGLYRHVLGGSAMEQIIDGSLCTFGSPAYDVASMAMLDNNEFLVLFTGGKLVKYTYDPDIPAVPVGKVRVYSLRESETIRQVISLYQAANPSIYVEYEVGMGENDSVTRDDALKSLNTRIMAGEGPDVLILDNMPIDSYIEKGLLTDISPLLDEMSGEDGLFPNIVDAFRERGHIYAMPCEVQIPFILGRSEDVVKMKDLTGIADAVEDLREGNPGENLLEISSEKGIMRMFSMVSAPAWKTESGEINGEAIAEFLTQTKRIYDAQMDGLPERAIREWEEISDYYVETLGETIEDSDYIRMYEGEMGFIGNMRKMAMGSLLDSVEYAKQISVTTMDGFEDCEIIPMNGQCSDVFWARTLVGISAAAQDISQAEDFLRVVFGAEAQTSLLGGMAVNRGAVLADFENRKSKSKDNIYGSLATSSDDGTYVQLVIRVPEQEEVDALVTWMGSVTTPYVEDDMFEEAVYEEGIAYMQGRKSLSDAVDAIEKKLAIYLAE